MLFTAASMIAAVNSILGGAGLALLAGTLTPLGSPGWSWPAAAPSAPKPSPLPCCFDC
jgi:hypothetical protein